jgi:hypothetical protein
MVGLLLGALGEEGVHSGMRMRMNTSLPRVGSEVEARGEVVQEEISRMGVQEGK